MKTAQVELGVHTIAVEQENLYVDSDIRGNHGQGLRSRLRGICGWGGKVARQATYIEFVEEFFDALSIACKVLGN